MPTKVDVAAISQVAEVDNTVSTVASMAAVTEVDNTVSTVSSMAAVTEVDNTVSTVASMTAVTEIDNTVSTVASMVVVVEVGDTQPGAIISDVNGAINTPVTFDGSASSGDTFSWAWTSVPAGSAFATPGPVPYPDDGATTPIDMTDNEGLYHFDGNANDTSGNSRNGSVVGATQVAGKVGSNAYRFNSSPSTYITLGAVTDYHFTTGSFTISGWFKPGSSQEYFAPLFSCIGGGGWGSNTRGYWVDQADGNTNRYRWAIRTGSTSMFGSNFSLTADVWNHVAAVRDGASFKIYVNGALQTSDTLNASINQTGNGSSLILGRHGLDYSYNHEWNGDIDEFAIWSRALSASEVADIYVKQSQVAGFVDLGQTSSGTATLYPDNGASTPVNMANNGALFHFNNNLANTSGNSNSLTTSNTSFATGFDGTANGSLKFNGTTSTALLTNPVSMSGDWTVAFWFYNLLPKTTWRTGLRGSNRDHQIIVEHSGDRLGVYDNNNGAFRPSGFDMPSGTYQGWHHIVAVGSGSTTTFYVNGVNVGSSDRKSTDNVYSIGNYQLASSGGAQQQFAERIDEFAAWTRALSATEIANIYSLQSAGKVSITSSATFTPDVIGTYQAQFTAFRGAFADTVTVTANITETYTEPSSTESSRASTGLLSRALAGGLVGATTLSYASVRPGSLLPFGMAAAITSTASSPAEEASSPAEETSSPAEEASSPAEEEEDDMKLIFNTTLTSDSSTISTGTLDTGYRDLLITASLKSDRNSTLDTGLIEFNGDGTDSNYAHVRMFAEQNPAVNGALSNTSGVLRLLGNVVATSPGLYYSPSPTANYHTAITLRIPRYENTTVYKNWQVIDGSNNPPTGVSPITNHTTGTWKNTAAITSITLRLEHGGFVAGSSLAVYGIK